MVLRITRSLFFSLEKGKCPSLFTLPAASLGLILYYKCPDTPRILLYPFIYLNVPLSRISFSSVNPTSVAMSPHALTNVSALDPNARDSRLPYLRANLNGIFLAGRGS